MESDEEEKEMNEEERIEKRDKELLSIDWQAIPSRFKKQLND